MTAHRAARYFGMFQHWARIAAGTSYSHQDQSPGKRFRPGELCGYFNDLTAKAAWPGRCDDDGLPLCAIDDRIVHWPTTVIQIGLANWDLWLESGRRDLDRWKRFCRVAEWLLKSQDSRGGWSHPLPHGKDDVSEYSCLSQGQGASVLVRFYKETGQKDALYAARRGIDAMLIPVARGGTAVYLDDLIILEEYPSSALLPVLNGWIFAIFGLYDYGLTSAESDVQAALTSTLGALQKWLPRFDCGFWSFYDTGGTIASPFYHRLHISQLEVLSATFPDRVEFGFWRDRFRMHHESRLKTSCAVAQIAFQKLRRPPASSYEL